VLIDRSDFDDGKGDGSCGAWKYTVGLDGDGGAVAQMALVADVVMVTVMTSLRIEEHGSGRDTDDLLCYGDSCENDPQVPACCDFPLNVYPCRYCCLLLVLIWPSSS